MSDNCDICVKFFTYNMDVPFFEHGLALIIFYQYARISPFIKGVVSAELAL